MSASGEMPTSFVPDDCLNHSSDATGSGNTVAKRLESVSDGKQRPWAMSGTSWNAIARSACLNADTLAGRICLIGVDRFGAKSDHAGLRSRYK
jgi:hypothetical protein